MVDHSKPPCTECGSYDAERHHPRCTLQTLEQRAATGLSYYESWLKQEKEHAKERESWWKRKQKDEQKLREQITFWQGKFRIVVAENNALRKKKVA